MSQIQSDASLFYHDKDHIAIENLSTLGNVIGTRITAEDKTRYTESHGQNSDDKNQMNCFTHISSNILWAYLRNQTKTQRALEKKLEPFHLMAQEQISYHTKSNTSWTGKFLRRKITSRRMSWLQEPEPKSGSRAERRAGIHGAKRRSDEVHNRKNRWQKIESLATTGAHTPW
jgi:hypothetical protein